MGRRKDRPFEDLTWSDLEDWAGKRIVSRGRAYQRQGLVRDLAITERGELLAWVEGTNTYATKVSIENGSISSVCTCPYHLSCKHAVAVILEYLEMIRDNRMVPRAGRDDPRIKQINEVLTSKDDEWAESVDRVDVTDRVALIEEALGRKTKKELLALIREIMEETPELMDEIETRFCIKAGPDSELVKRIENEIINATSEPGWYDYRRGCGYRPDYSKVEKGLKRLLSRKQYEAIIRLGEKLLTLGKEQVEISHDEGEIAYDISACMNIVFTALKKSSMPNPVKMEKAVDFLLRDEYELCSGLEEFWKQRFSKKDWSELADRLMRCLKEFPDTGSLDFSSRFRRDRLTDEIINALENAGRQEEALELCRKEAEITDSYLRLVRYLRKTGLKEEAEKWIYRGIVATAEKYPGIASSLKEELIDIRKKARDWLFIAAIIAEDFFREPSLFNYKKLKEASRKAKVWKTVRKAALRFLETGKRTEKGGKGWPLPDTGLQMPGSRWQNRYPIHTLLIEIAIYEKRTDDVLRWYDSYKNEGKGWGHESLEDSVADAIAREYPEKALEIWKRLAEEKISQTGVNFYTEGARYLRKIRGIMKGTGRKEEWITYIKNLKAAYPRKRRLQEILDALIDEPILKTKPRKETRG